MKFYAKAEQAATQILEAFQAGNVPKSLAPIFIHRHDDVPCRQWSWSNQLLAALAGHSDARGYRQWQAVGRHVKKGERAFQILVPLARKIEGHDEKTGEIVERMAVYGFKSAAVFGLAQTEGEPLADPDPEVTAWLETLPLLEVARSWGLSVDAFNGEGARCLGKYRHRQSIALGVKNLSTWAHELCHAADDRNVGGLKGGQHLDQEVVAELGGAVLLETLGFETESDRGGCWDYVRSYAAAGKVEPIAVCQQLLTRTCQAVSLILDSAETLQSESAAA